MKISVITVAYNAETTIADTLASVKAQTWGDYEHIVIDGASTDGTHRILAEHANSRLIVVSEPDGGIFDAMNKGLRLAGGDLIGFLNADDFYARVDALATLAGAAQRDDRAAAIGAGVALVDPRNTRRIRRYYPSGDFRPWMLRFGHMPPHPGFYVRRGAMAQVGEFDPQLRTGRGFRVDGSLLSCSQAENAADARNPCGLPVGREFLPGVAEPAQYQPGGPGLVPPVGHPVERPGDVGEICREVPAIPPAPFGLPGRRRRGVGPAGEFPVKQAVPTRPNPHIIFGGARAVLWGGAIFKWRCAAWWPMSAP